MCTPRACSQLYDTAHEYLLKTIGRRGTGSEATYQGVDEHQAVVHYEVLLGYLWGQRRVQGITASLGEPFTTIANEHEDNKQHTIEMMHVIERTCVCTYG